MWLCWSTWTLNLGRRAQWLEEVCLLEQLFVMDGSQRVQDVLLQASQAARMPLAITGFVRLQVGSSPCPGCLVVVRQKCAAPRHGVVVT